MRLCGKTGIYRIPVVVGGGPDYPAECPVDFNVIVALAVMKIDADKWSRKGRFNRRTGPVELRLCGRGKVEPSKVIDIGVIGRDQDLCMAGKRTG